MARIHSVNLYPRPNHSAKGQTLRLTSALPPGMGFGGQAPAFSAAQARAESRERDRVAAGAPGHLQAQGQPMPPVITGRPIIRPPSGGPQGVWERLQAAGSRLKGPAR